MNDSVPLDCDTERDEKKYLCVYNSDEDDNFKRKHPIDCKLRKTNIINYVELIMLKKV